MFIPAEIGGISSRTHGPYIFLIGNTKSQNTFPTLPPQSSPQIFRKSYKKFAKTWGRNSNSIALVVFVHLHGGKKNCSFIHCLSHPPIHNFSLQSSSKLGERALKELSILSWHWWNHRKTALSCKQDQSVTKHTFLNEPNWKLLILKFAEVERKKKKKKNQTPNTELKQNW